MNKAETTRQAILQKAFELMYVNGYRTTSIDAIIAGTQLTKSAFFYHFRNKDEMGAAIIEEVMKPALADSFTRGLAADPDPLDAIYNLIHTLLLKTKFLQVAYGCPAANFVHDMVPGNETFTRMLDELAERWIGQMTALISRGKKEGLVAPEVDPRQTTLFIISGYWGVRTLGKLRSARAAYVPYLKALKQYLATLR